MSKICLGSFELNVGTKFWVKIVNASFEQNLNTRELMLEEKMEKKKKML